MARNLVLAHLLGPEQYGTAVTLVIITAAAEMLTTLGLPQLIISHKSGAARSFQANLHVFQLARGVVGAGIVFLSAAPLANALAAPDLTSILRYAAVIPLMLGFIHLDPYRSQRHQNHLPQIAVLSLPALMSLGLLWPLSLVQSGPKLMLILLLVQAATTVAVSHLVSARRYRLGLRLPHIPQVLRYGLPLAVNGVLMFGVLHAEKLIAGVHLGLQNMGVLAMGFTLTLTPALVSARSFQAYNLPKLRAHGGSVLGVSFLLAAWLLTALALILPLTLPLLGDGFHPIAPLVPVLSCIAATRLPKSALATAALAKGHTSLPALTNLPRAFALPIIWAVLAQGGTVEDLLTIALVAEVAGLGVGAYLAGKMVHPPKEMVLALTVAVLVMTGQLALAAIVCIMGCLFLTRKATAMPQGRST